MIVAGIDAGTEVVKAVILSDGVISAFSLVRAGPDYQRTCEEALAEALEIARLRRQEVARLAVTGIGRKELAFATMDVTEVAADARGVNSLLPNVRTIVDVGAESARAVRCDGAGGIVRFARNDKCAAGVGVFLEAMARALETALDEMGQMSLQCAQVASVNSTCVIFAESEVVALIHGRTPKPDIAAGIHESIAARIASMVGKVGKERDVAFIGGAAKNVGVVDRLEKHLGMKLVVPDQPQILGALGAALLANE